VKVKEMSGGKLTDNEIVVLVDIEAEPRRFELLDANAEVESSHAGTLHKFHIGPVPPGVDCSGSWDYGGWYKAEHDFVYVEQRPKLTAEQKLEKLVTGLTEALDTYGPDMMVHRVAKDLLKRIG